MDYYIKLAVFSLTMLYRDRRDTLATNTKATTNSHMNKLKLKLAA